MSCLEIHPNGRFWPSKWCKTSCGCGIHMVCIYNVSTKCLSRIWNNLRVIIHVHESMYWKQDTCIIGQYLFQWRPWFWCSNSFEDLRCWQQQRGTQIHSRDCCWLLDNTKRYLLRSQVCYVSNIMTQSRSNKRLRYQLVFAFPRHIVWRQECSFFDSKRRRESRIKPMFIARTGNLTGLVHSPNTEHRDPQ